MGNIALCDGRELLIFPDWKSTREAERMLRENGDFRELAALRRVRNVLPVDAVRNFKCSLGCVFVKLRAGGPPMLITDDEIRDALKAALESEARE